MTKSQAQQRTTPKSLTVRHCNLFSCSNSLRLPVHCDTSSKNTVAHSTFEHMDHHDISKIVILPHKSHVSRKYKCMNDGFFINQRADNKNLSAQNTILCRKWLLQKLTFHQNEITIFEHSQYPTQRTFGEPPAPIYIYTRTSCKYVGPLPASYCRTQNWYKFGKAWYFLAWEISWVWSFSSVVLGHLAGSPSLDQFFLSHRPGFGAKVFSTEESSKHVKEGNMTEIICCHGTPPAGIFWISHNPWVKLWPGVTPLTSKVSTTCVSIFYLMNHQSCQMRNASLHQHHFAPRIVGKGGILEAFGVGAVCCNWASLQYLIFIGRSQESRVVEAFADWQRGTCTFLTTLSLSAIATNGKIAGGGAYYLCLGMCLVIFFHSVFSWFRGATMLPCLCIS